MTEEMKAQLNSEAYIHIKRPLFEEADYLNLKNYLFSYIETIPERLRPTFFTSNPYVKKPAYSDWVASPPLTKLLTEFFGADLVFVNLSICYKPAKSVYRVARHIDSQYLLGKTEASPQDYYNVFISFSDCKKDSGCLRVLPKINDDKLYKHKPTNKEFNFFVNEIDDPSLDISKMVDVEMGPNEVCIMKNSLVHESGPNSSAEPRLAVVLRYASAAAKISINKVNGPFRLHLVSGRNVAGNVIEDLEGLEKVGGFSWSKA